MQNQAFNYQLFEKIRFKINKIMHILNTLSTAVGKRWYDKNSLICSAFEMLKYIDTSKKNDLLKEFLCSLKCINNIKPYKRNMDFVHEYIYWN